MSAADPHKSLSCPSIEPCPQRRTRNPQITRDALGVHTTLLAFLCPSSAHRLTEPFCVPDASSLSSLLTANVHASTGAVRQHAQVSRCAQQRVRLIMCLSSSMKQSTRQQSVHVNRRQNCRRRRAMPLQIVPRSVNGDIKISKTKASLPFLRKRLIHYNAQKYIQKNYTS